MTTDPILFVDDEPNVLSAIKRMMRGQFELVTAESGRDALALIAGGQKFSVIVSDCRMPEMDGVEFLAKAAKLSPLSVRVMLTGNTDQETAVRAVNTGDIFKFLNKPCDADTLKQALKQSLRQHQLLTAEKELLEKTLRQSIKVLSELLGIVKPSAFGRTSRLRRKAKEISAHLEGVKGWELDAAVLLSQLGCVNIGEATLSKVLAGDALTREEKSEFAAHPLLGAELIGRIPRMERVAQIILYQHKHFDGSDFPIDDVKGDKIPLESRILHVVLAYDALSTQDWSDAAIMEELRKHTGRYDPAVIEALEKSVDVSDSAAVTRVLPSEVQLGMIIQEDVQNNQGVMLICRGQEVTTAIREHLLKFERSGALTKRILVSVPAQTRADKDPNRAVA